MEIEKLADLVLAQQDTINKLIGQNAAIRTALMALIVSHPDREAFVAQFERMREVATAKSLYVAAEDASLDEAERVLNELSAPWRRAGDQ